MTRPLQEAIAARLRSDDFFSMAPAIPIVTRCGSDVLTAMGEALAAARLTCLVWPVSGRFTHHGYPNPTAELELSIKMVENPAMNRTGGSVFTTAEEAAWAAARRLWNWIPLHAGTGAQITGGPVKPGGIESRETALDGGALLFVCEFSLTATISDPEPRASVRGGE